MADVAQLVELRIVGPVVAGSNPVVHPKYYAGVAQLVEQLTCNQQVGGSNPFASFALAGSSMVEQVAVNHKVVGSNPTLPVYCGSGGIGRRTGLRNQ